VEGVAGFVVGTRSWIRWVGSIGDARAPSPVAFITPSRESLINAACGWCSSFSHIALYPGVSGTFLLWLQLLVRQQVPNPEEPTTPIDSGLDQSQIVLSYQKPLNP